MDPLDQPLTSPAVSRRGFLAAGGAGVVGMSLRDALAARSAANGAVIQIVLNGGASHLETFDPKPYAPREIRGPLHSIATSIPGVRFSESLPRLAERANRLVIVRSLFHAAAPIHETGLQLLFTGQLVRRGFRAPHIGILLQHLQPPRSGGPACAFLGGALQQTGTSAYRGDGPGVLHAEEGLDSLPEPTESGRLQFSRAPRNVRDRFGENRFGQLFWTAARLIERGTRYVCVNTFDRLEGETTWDAHGCPESGPATVFDYRDTLGPQFDRALAALIDDLQQSGMWSQTLIACAGEMGRSPRLNPRGGRDHWTQAWSGLLAGGSLPGGHVLGESDEHGDSILNDPVELSQIPAFLLDWLGVPAGSEIVLRDGVTLRTPSTMPRWA